MCLAGLTAVAGYKVTLSLCDVLISFKTVSPLHSRKKIGKDFDEKIPSFLSTAHACLDIKQFIMKLIDYQKKIEVKNGLQFKAAPTIFHVHLFLLSSA